MHCGGIPCDDGSVSGFGCHADIGSYPADSDLRRPLADTPGGLRSSVIAALAG